MQFPSHDQPRRPHRRGGFTLAELLIVIGIIAILIALLVPVVTGAMTRGRRVAQEAALNSIAQALEAYKSDFGDYPRFDTAPVPDDDPVGGALNDDRARGARLLTRALFGPAPKTQEGIDAEDAYGDDELLRNAFQDGHDGYGIRGDRQIVSDGGDYAFYFPGETSGPYLDSTGWTFGVYAAANDETSGYTPASGIPADRREVVLLDRNNRPILYYPARAKQPDIRAVFSDVSFPATGGTSRVSGGLVSVTPHDARQQGLYNAIDGWPFLEPSLASGDAADANEDGYPDTGLLNRMLGDVDDDNNPANGLNPDGAIGAGEEPATTAPFLLIASDDDGNFTPDSVANFTPRGQE